MRALTGLNSEDTKSLKVHDIVMVGLLSATITAGKLALSFVPNVEIVTLLFIVFTVSLGLKKALLVSVIFSTTEILIYGFSTWILGYYLIWPLLVIITWFVNKTINSEYVYAAIGGFFGLFFGFFFALVESIFYGWAYGVSYWLRGIPMDVLHGASNFIIVLLLFEPLYRIFKKCKNNEF